MPERSIHSLYWSVVASECASCWIAETSTLFGIWPAPVSHDQCFSEAGFRDFADPDNLWDQDWAQIIQRLLDHLQQYGTPRLHNQDDVLEVLPWYSLLYRLLWFKPLQSPVHVSTAQRLIISTEDDRFPNAIVDFGEPLKIRLRTGAGHPICWLAVNSEVVLDSNTLLTGIAAGRQVIRMDLEWRHLIW